MMNPFEKNPFTKETEKAKSAESTESAKSAESVKSDEALVESVTKLEAIPKEEKAKPDPVKTSSTPNQSDKPKRRSAAQERDELAKRVAELEAKLEQKADSADIQVFHDKVLAEESAAGAVRLVSDGRTLMNNDWRVTKDGLRVLVGRSSMQAQTHFQIPVSLVKSLSDLLSYFDHLEDV